ncbi:MAG: hypothetical protein NC320_13465 [Clostridium sp.]|nr:hypothetical protein [Clostridium sp.]MCM1547101.1 hypothetical protein [Ruminococcus sp.]
MKKIIAICTVITMIFCGCSKENTEKSSSEMPSDKPWNRLVMETDKGYYYMGPEEYGRVMSLRYTEKSNGADIFLCAKPECPHDGSDTCTATYNFMPVSNTILYDGGIYFVADTTDKETYGVSLYRASLDGSSLDKIGDVRRIKNSDVHTYYGGMDDFLIHKGYAYIPYNIGGGSYDSFIEDGFVKMDIQTGKADTIFSNDEFMSSLSASVYAGVGDYVYYGAFCSNGDKNRAGNFKYNINTGESEKISGELAENLESGHYAIEGYTEDTLYVREIDKGIDHFIGYDSKTFERNDFELDIYDPNIKPRCFFYDDKIFVTKIEAIEVYDNKGEKIGSHAIPSYCGEDGVTSQYSFDPRDFDICSGRIYMGYYDNMSVSGLPVEEGEFLEEERADYTMYSCSVEDVIAGTGDWEKAYVKKNYLNYWDNVPTPQFIKDSLTDEQLKEMGLL